MKTLLYIAANCKPEESSSCLTVGRRLVDAIKKKLPGVETEELDLYKTRLPRMKAVYFVNRSGVINASANAEAWGKLTAGEREEVEAAGKLCDGFIGADIYVLAAPMWSLSFPAPVKDYIDCVAQAGKTLSFEDNKPKGLLCDKPRIFIYVQSSGAELPWLVRPVLNRGLNYVCDIMKSLGIETFEELLVDGTGWTEAERLEAVRRASEKIGPLTDRLF